MLVPPVKYRTNEARAIFASPGTASSPFTSSEGQIGYNANPSLASAVALAYAVKTVALDCGGPLPTEARAPPALRLALPNDSSTDLSFRPEMNPVPFTHLTAERYFQQLPAPWPAWQVSVAQNVKVAQLASASHHAWQHCADLVIVSPKSPSQRTPGSGVKLPVLLQSIGGAGGAGGGLGPGPGDGGGLADVVAVFQAGKWPRIS